ncbi:MULTISPECIES: hypothetical protein [unclassified Streptomyces]|uniref:hypothetical protein n=1 Tax=unclassified Streptomyces TaxID=2593676 RepID=UPI00364C3DE1
MDTARTIEPPTPSHVDSVRRHFADLLSPEQIEAFAAIGETVLGRLTDRDARPAAGRR